MGNRTVEAFKNRFAFDPAKACLVGVERECFTKVNGHLVPAAQKVLEQLDRLDLNLGGTIYGPELSACQIESRIGPCTIDALPISLVENRNALGTALYQAGIESCYEEVAPESMPRDVYPDPAGRYESIRRTMSMERLLAACRIIGTHVHIGMPDHETALNVYNTVIRYCDELVSLGDGSNGERMKIYQIVTGKSPVPEAFGGWSHFHRTAVVQGFLDDPRRCWALIRISVHGTIEFRMFGATKCIDKIARWARVCHALCMDAMT